MPWTDQDYPQSLKNLMAPVRRKAIEIANALVEREHMEEGRAIAIATAKAEEWAKNRRQQIYKKSTGRTNADSAATDSG
ncbi:MAG: DUF2188 domain-containing protein [bacterium]|nr:DUF2188 domain-containing protein [bacterium]